MADADRQGAGSPCHHRFSRRHGTYFFTESYRYAAASVVAPFDYTSMVWALLLGYLMFGEKPTPMIILGSAIIAAAGLFVIWRERQLALPRQRAVEGTTTSLQTP